MPFTPHTPKDIAQMLETIGEQDVRALFDEVPASIPAADFSGLAPGLNELETTQLMHERANQNQQALNFIGAGSYEHHIPAAVWELTSRGEFLTAYTPYQAEASQGSLQLIYEFQTMIASLTAMEVANASLYDGASALAEAVLMAVRANRKVKSKRILMPATVHPHYRATVSSIVKQLDIELVNVDFSRDSGTVTVSDLNDEDFVALVIPYPNFFGCLEEVDALTDWAHEKKALVVAVANPTALAMLKPPGEWGETGADIVCGEGQPLGIPMYGGGPYAGYMCCKQAIVRQMPGRIVGMTVDQDGRDGFALTLQAREQHIRRSKATSNICTNQGLLVTAATIYMSLLGPEGLYKTALGCHQNTTRLVDTLTAIDGVSTVFAGTYFHECVLRITKPAKEVLKALAARGILGGVALGDYYPELADTILVCATETKTPAMIAKYQVALQEVMEEVAHV